MFLSAAVKFGILSKPTAVLRMANHLAKCFYLYTCSSVFNIPPAPFHTPNYLAICPVYCCTVAYFSIQAIFRYLISHLIFLYVELRLWIIIVHISAANTHICCYMIACSKYVPFGNMLQHLTKCSCAYRYVCACSVYRTQFTFSWNVLEIWRRLGGNNYFLLQLRKYWKQRIRNE
jgi:hypothetical protein